MATTLQIKTRKLADIGGDGNGTNFEAAFSDLAHAYAREKAPTLAPYELGFQVLERNDDGNKAVGITGYDSGTLIYLPVFWLNGKIKGHELMYLQESDLFVPLKDSWLQYLLRRQAPRIGEGRSPSAISSQFRRPNLLRLTRSSSKRGSIEGPDWACRGLDGMLKPPGPAKPAQSCLLEFLKTGQAAARAFHKFALANPELALAAQDFHGDALCAAVKVGMEQKAVPPRTSFPKVSGLLEPLDRPDVRVFTYTPGFEHTIPADLPPDARMQLLRDGIYVRDRRKVGETTRVLEEDAKLSIANPTGPGIFDVLMRDGETKKCAVLPVPWAPGGRWGGAMVIDVSGGSPQKMATAPLSEIYVTGDYPSTELEKFAKEFPNAGDGLPDGRCLLVTPRGEASLPFTTRSTIWSKEGSAEYDAWCDVPWSDGVTRTPEHLTRDDQAVIVDNTVGTHFRAVDGRLYVPKSAHVIRVDYNGLDLGKPRDIQGLSRRWLNKIAVFSDGLEVSIRRDAYSSGLMPANEARAQLVVRHGLTDADACTLLKRASVARRASVFAKFAEPYLDDYQSGPVLDMHNGQTSDWNMLSGESVPQESPYGQEMPVDVPEYYQQPAEQVHRVDPSDGNEAQIAQQAAQSGRQDVFDASVLTTMLRGMRDDQLIDRYIPTLAKAMDALGRMLFSFYWHQEDYAERYGDRDMPELEDAIRNMFEGVGDLVLKLKQKTVDTLSGGSLGVSLHDAAGAS